MTTFRRVGNKVHRVKYTVHRKKIWEKMARLYKMDNVIPKSVTNAFGAVLNNKTSVKEILWIDKIELLRNKLSTSSTKVSIVDYGAGSLENSDLIVKEIYEGRVITRTIGETCQRNSISQLGAFLLFKLIRELKPSVCLELGTLLGISTAYQAAALELNQHGRIVSIEGAKSLASLAKKNFEKLGLKERVMVRVGRFQDILQDVLREQKHIDFAFVDGHHTENATLKYFNLIYPFLSEDGVFVLDDISSSKGMARAWDTLTIDKRIKVSIDLHKLGICIISDSQEKRQGF